MSVAAPPRPVTGRCGVEVLTQSYALRTSLRRAINAASSEFVLVPSSGGPTSADDLPATGAVVIDAEMPGLSGTALVERIAGTRSQVKVVVVVADTARGRVVRERALKAGVAGAFVRPETDEPRALKPLAAEILTALRKTARPRPAPKAGAAPGAGARSQTPSPGRSRPLVRIKPRILVVGSSTGGPQALMDVFKSFGPRDANVPVLIVQHMPAAFTPILAEHLSRATEWTAREGQHGEPLAPGEIRIAPGGQHMTLVGDNEPHTIALTSDPPVNFCKPSVDVLFLSAAHQFGAGVLSLVLTGMGNDGASGVKAISSSGGMVFAQDEDSSVVWGMPGAAVATGVVDKVLPLAEIAGALRLAFAGGVHAR